jgi:hypothetical protein
MIVSTATIDGTSTFPFLTDSDKPLTPKTELGVLVVQNLADAGDPAIAEFTATLEGSFDGVGWVTVKDLDGGDRVQSVPIFPFMRLNVSANSADAVAHLIVPSNSGV